MGSVRVGSNAPRDRSFRRGKLSMIFQNSRRLSANQLCRTETQPRTPGGNYNQRLWIHHRVSSSLLSLAIWLLVIGAFRGLTTGYLSLRGCGKSGARQEINDRQPARRDHQRYSARYVDAVRRAALTDRDFLASYAAFVQVWREVSPD
jgi:hypothetical protein